MADDDLDAFFDDVDNAVKEVQEADEEADHPDDVGAAVSGDEEPRPAKRAKPDAAPAAKAVVASSVPVVSIGAPPLPAGAPPLPAAAPPPPPPTSAGGYAAAPPPAALPPPLPPPPDAHAKPHVRSAAGQTWSDPTLIQWPAADFRLFVGNLAKDLKQHHLEQHFKAKYPSFAMARIMYDKADGKSRGYGFVSLLDAKDCARAIREMDQSWLGSRPIKVKLSEWKEREWKQVKKKGKAEKRKKKKHFGHM